MIDEEAYYYVEEHLYVRYVRTYAHKFGLYLARERVLVLYGTVRYGTVERRIKKVYENANKDSPLKYYRYVRMYRIRIPYCRYSSTERYGTVLQKFRHSTVWYSTS